MGTPVDCRSCGQRQDLPEGYSRPHFRCTACGAINEAPACSAVKAPALFDMFKAGPAQTVAAPARIVPSQPPGERQLLLQGTDDDDLNPYSVRGDVPTAKCPECGKAIHEGVSVCKHCGTDFEAKKKAERTYESVQQEWEEGWPFQKRISAIVILQVINVVLLLAGLLTVYFSAASFVAVLLLVGLQAFLAGTYDRLNLTRTAKGKVVLTRTRRYAFLERRPETIRWKEHEGVSIVGANTVDSMELVILIILFVPCIIPGILFWLFYLRGDRFDVALCKDHGYAAMVIFRTGDQERARQIMTKVSDIAALPVLK